MIRIGEETKSLYHGTTESFKNYNLEKRRTKDSLGFNLTDSIKHARKYGSIIYKVIVDYDNPLDLSHFHDDDFNSFVKSLPLTEVQKEHLYRIGSDNFLPFYFLELANKEYNLVDKLKKEDYDMLIYYDEGYNTYIPLFNDVVIDITRFE